MKHRNRSKGDPPFDVSVDAEADDQTSLVDIETYGMTLWRNGLVGASRMVFKGLYTLAQAWKRPEIARYSQVLDAIDGGVPYEAFAAEMADEGN